MADVLTRAQRSFNMSCIRSRWTSHERTIHGLLKGRKIKHRMHPPLPGRPDVLVFPDLVVYLHGCYWHGCPTCYVPAKSRQEYWHPKIDRNRLRDRRNTRAVRRAGYRVLCLWEHDLKRDMMGCVVRILRMAEGKGRL